MIDDMSGQGVKGVVSDGEDDALDAHHSHDPSNEQSRPPEQACSSSSVSPSRRTNCMQRLSTGGKASTSRKSGPEREPFCTFLFTHKHINNKPARLSFDNGECIFCGSLVEDEGHTLGPIIHFGTINIHQLCLLVASATKQSEEGMGNPALEDFTCKAVITEFKRGRKLRCVYCQKRGATIGCVVKNCKVCFHLPCGKANASFHKFTGAFPSWCKNHIPPPPAICLGDSGRNKINSSVAYTFCGICLTNRIPMKAKLGEVIRTSCCKWQTSETARPKKKYRYYCHSCVQHLVINSGALSQCPFKCSIQEGVGEEPNATNIFKEQIQEFGIFVPDRDALWERDGNFDDQNKRPDFCILAGDCKCPQGAEYNDNVGMVRAAKWELFDNCATCGAVTIHRQCAGPPWNDLEDFEKNFDDEKLWICFGCKELKDNEESEMAPGPSTSHSTHIHNHHQQTRIKKRDSVRNLDFEALSREDSPLKLNLKLNEGDDNVSFALLRDSPTPEPIPPTPPPMLKLRPQRHSSPIKPVVLTKANSVIAIQAVTNAKKLKFRKRKENLDSKPAVATTSHRRTPSPLKLAKSNSDGIELSSDDEPAPPKSPKKWLQSPSKTSSPKKSPVKKKRKMEQLPGQLKMEQFFSKLNKKDGDNS